MQYIGETTKQKPTYIKFPGNATSCGVREFQVLECIVSLTIMIVAIARSLATRYDHENNQVVNHRRCADEYSSFMVGTDAKTLA